jgi:uncharacterized hydrophobic protein (TIGR00271 family)
MTARPEVLDNPAAGEPPVGGPALLDALFPGEAEHRRSLESYFVLLTLAGLIATFGLLENSVAAIIGAMIVAPMGGAIMSLAAALVTGRGRWQLTFLLQVAIGALIVVGTGFFIAWILPNPLDLTSELDARTQPGLLDLGVALAAGAAGAYVAVRRTGADALPGVAIAVSLVPPLATVGVCLAYGRFDDAAGSGLLFLTNFSAIVVIAVIVFVAFGAAPSRDMLWARHRMWNGFLVAVAALGLIAIPLAWRGLEDLQNTIRASEGAPVVTAWIGNRQLSVEAWTVDGDFVHLDLAGPDSPPSVPDLAKSLAETFGVPVQVDVDYVQTERQTVTAAP